MLDKNANTTTKYKSLEDLNLLSLWWQSGTDWSSTIQEEIQADTNQPIIEDEFQPTSKVVLLGVLVILAISVITVGAQASEIYHSVQKVGVNSFKELISQD